MSMVTSSTNSISLTITQTTAYPKLCHGMQVRVSSKLLPPQELGYINLNEPSNEHARS